MAKGEERLRGWRGLTGCEQELLPLLREGLTYKEMAVRRGVSHHTVRAQLHALYEKLGVAGLGNARIRAVRVWEEGDGGTGRRGDGEMG